MIEIFGRADDLQRAVGGHAAQCALPLRAGLRLFDAVRIDFSLRRLIHYTGADWRTIQPWILFTNYQRYVDHFLTWAMEELAKPDGAYTQLVLPGGAVVTLTERATGRLWRVRLSTAVVPYLLGFVPSNSLVVIGADRKSVV